MENRIDLEHLLSTVGKGQTDCLSLFAIVNLGLIESLANGLMSAAEAVQRFYFADNCLYVRKVLKDKAADQIMCRGVQLPDLFDCLPVDEAQREFLHELATMRNLCLELLESRRKAA